MSVIDKFLMGFRSEDDGERGIIFRKPDKTVWVRQADGTEALVGGGSAPFAPTDLDGLALWLDAADADTINAGSPSDGDPVSAWSDKSDAGNEAVQATSDNRPIFKTSQRNGRSVVRFDPAVDPQFLELTGLGLFRALDGMTIAAALSATGQGGGSSPLYALTNDGTGPRMDFEFYFFDATKGAVAMQTVVNGDDAASVGSQTSTDSGQSPASVVVAQTFDPPTWNIEPASFLNLVGSSPPNDPLTPGSLPDTDSSAIYVGQNPSDGGWSGDLFELIVVRRACTAVEQRQLREYLSAKWNTP